MAAAYSNGICQLRCTKPFISACKCATIEEAKEERNTVTKEKV